MSVEEAAASPSARRGDLLRTSEKDRPATAGGATASPLRTLKLALRFSLREMRGGLSGFVIFITCIALGVAAISGVNSVARSITGGVAEEGQALLGGDIRFELNQRQVTDAEREFIEGLGTVAASANMRSMARLDDGSDQALVEVKAIEEGRLSLDDEFLVSENAWRKGGAPSRTSTMFAAVNSNVRLDDLLRGIMIQNANDACIAIAEGMAGSEQAFAVMMNERAGELGLSQSNFVNATGLPATEGEQGTMSVRDLVTLARHVIHEYPRLYSYFSEPEFTWNKIRQLNKNPLIGLSIGADGIFTGYDEEGAGYGMVASAAQDGQRIIAAIHGLPSGNQRVNEMQKLLAWGFRSFDKVTLFKTGEPVGEVGVFGGSEGWVALAGREPIQILIPKGAKSKLRARIVYNGPLRAPVEEGQNVGVLQVMNDEELVSEVPLYATQSVDVGPLYSRALDAAYELVVGLIHSGVNAATGN